jgi:hypothetical protein
MTTAVAESVVEPETFMQVTVYVRDPTSIPLSAFVPEAGIYPVQLSSVLEEAQVVAF